MPRTTAASIAAIRSAGHAAATAHMADHCLRSASYALTAIRAYGKDPKDERNWQLKRLHSSIAEIVTSATLWSGGGELPGSDG